MGVHSQQLKLLSFVEDLLKQTQELKVTFTCRCMCSFYVDGRGRAGWQVFACETPEEVHSWMARHKNHEFYLSVQVEGIVAAASDRRHEPSGHVRQADAAARSKSLARIAKLKALAGGTTYQEEADSARSLASFLEAKHRSSTGKG